VSTSTPTTPPGCAINYWRWDYGDGQFDAGNFPTASHDYALKGHTYQVTLTVTNPGGTASIIVPVTTQS
jgi:PKD repeat protein